MGQDLSIVAHKPNAELIRRLEEVVQMAKDGGITDFALCYCMPDGNGGDAFYSSNRPVNLIGGLRLLERNLIDGEVSVRCHKAGDKY